MTREEKIEQLQDQVEHNRITGKELGEICDKYNLSVYEDVLSPIEYTYCDRCGALERVDEACWVDYMDLDDENDKKVHVLLMKEDKNCCAICDMCYHELANKKGE